MFVGIMEGCAYVVDELLLHVAQFEVVRFLTVGAFSMLFFLSLYYGYSITDMLINYLYILVPLICLSLMYSLVYTNSFYSAMKVAILLRFMEGKEKASEKKE